MAERLAPGDYDQLHHFVAAGVWDAAPTQENLKELGVASFGHRVKLLDAVAALRNDAGGKAPSVDAANRSSAPSTRPEDRAERRQVTVMFSDLVGSTALSVRLDPEDFSADHYPPHQTWRHLVW
jgi:hypothetical protein